MLLKLRPSSSRGRLAARYAGGFAIAAAGAALTRWYSIDLAFGLNFLAGNSLGVLAVFVLPWPANIFGTFLSMLPSIALWGHPWALPACLLEGLMLALLLRGGHHDKVLVAEGLFWLFLGVPITLLQYAYFYRMPLDGAFAAAIKQGANAVVNAFIGVALYFAGRKIPGFGSPSQRRQSGRENLVFLMNGLLILPLGLVLFFYTAHFREITIDDISERTESILSMASESLAENSYSILQTVLMDRGYSALILSPSGSPIWSYHAGTYYSNDHMKLLATHGSSIILGPALQSNPMRMWQNAIVRTRRSLPGGSTILLEQPFGSYVVNLYRSMTAIFTYFLLMLSIAGTLAYAAAAIFLRPLELLRKTSESVQAGGFDAKWPEKGIQEIRELRDSLVAMTGAVTNKEMELSEAKATAERMMRMSEQYTAFMAHEIKAPLAAIISAIDSSEGGEDPSARLLPMIGTSLEHLVELVNEILDQASAGAGGPALRRKPFVLFKEAEDLLAPFAIQARRKGLRFVWKGDASLRQEVMGDALRFRQVLANLVSNAIKYTDKGFVQVDLSASTSDGRCILRGSVADSGIGIESALLDDIWKPFASGKGRLPDGQSSHGLGLSVVRRIVEGSGGSIRVESVEAQGSRFSFELNFDLVGMNDREAGSASGSADGSEAGSTRGAAEGAVAIKGAADPSAPASAQGPDLRSVSALVADDDRLSLMASVHFLRKWGAVVEEAEDGTQALLRAGEKTYALVLLDEHMPGKTGVEVARALRRMEKETGRARAFIVLSSAEQAERFMAFVPGIIDTVAVKPLRPEAFGRLLAARFPASARKG
jgi:signal transduction histidine kinase/CheY-like chemotaxis protein